MAGGLKAYDPMMYKSGGDIGPNYQLYTQMMETTNAMRRFGNALNKSIPHAVQMINDEIGTLDILIITLKDENYTGFEPYTLPQIVRRVGELQNNKKNTEPLKQELIHHYQSWYQEIVKQIARRDLWFTPTYQDSID